MLTELTRYLPTFKSAVLTGIDGAGYPFSVRCQPRLDAGAQVVRLTVGSAAPWREGPASLLCHDHDAQLWNQRSFLVRGELARDGDGWLFRPRQFIPGIGIGNQLIGFAKFLVGARRTARRYLEARGLPRPAIPWEAINRVKDRAQ